MRLKIGMNEGSLLRRTILHVAMFVIGSVAFVGITSLTLVSIVRGVAKPSEASAAESVTADSRSELPAPNKAKPGLKTSSRTKGAVNNETPPARVPEPRKDE